ncbi:hypothetical protein MHBO_002129 [Bonamia ostreae]|uniref:Uncharacterized protein n=1 Tax=Bonamia ostreae TaxID=126728 RepID=A0ABV2ALC8_9EUKA
MQIFRCLKQLRLFSSTCKNRRTMSTSTSKLSPTLFFTNEKHIALFTMLHCKFKITDDQKVGLPIETGSIHLDLRDKNGQIFLSKYVLNCTNCLSFLIDGNKTNLVQEHKTTDTAIELDISRKNGKVNFALKTFINDKQNYEKSSRFFLNEQETKILDIFLKDAVPKMNFSKQENTLWWLKDD